MNLNDVLNSFNFYTNKYLSVFYSIPEFERVLDDAQMAYYSDNKAKYATSNLIKEILAPFRATYNFTPSTTVSGYIVVPSNSNYLDLLDIQIEVDISSRTIYYGVKMVNEDERANMLNSQLDPVTVTSPIGEITAPRYFRLYPTAGYTGTVTYFRRPIAPVYGYDIISGRVPVYNAATSVQLEWRDSEINAIIIKALKIAGVNLSDAEVSNFAQISSESNYVGQNRI